MEGTVLARKYEKRFDIFAYIILFILLVLIFRLLFLQIYQGEYYQKQADGNRMRNIPFMAARGVIYDRNKIPLVVNRPGFVVLLSPSANKKEKIKMLEKLADILQMPVERIQEKLNTYSNGVEPIVIKEEVSIEQLTIIEERKREFPDVVVEVQPIRQYLYNEIGAHILGYVAESNESELKSLRQKGYGSGSRIGKIGLEKQYDIELRGKDGANRLEVNVEGLVVDEMERVEAVPGYNIILTIDYNLQEQAEAALQEVLKTAKATAAAAVVMDIRNGEILALASLPQFNPNLFVTGISQIEWDKLNNNPSNPMNNKAISGEYPPGSSFKVITAAAALEEKKVTANEQYFDAGYHHKDPAKGNDGGKVLGWINLRDALAFSDNVYFYEMGDRLGIDVLEKYAREFGFGAFTGIDLPGESDGLVANRRYKKKVYDEDWYLAETFDATIGQGFHLATPLQMVHAIAIIADDGRKNKPHLVRMIVADDGTIIKDFTDKMDRGAVPVSFENIQSIKAGLKGVGQAGGTAGQLADFPYPIAGKTGTSENPHGRDHGIFVGYAPADNPQIAVAIVVEQAGYASATAVPAARKIFASYFGVK